VFYELTESIIKRSTKEAMDLIDRVVMQGRDLSQFIVDEIGYLRNLLLVNSINESGSLLDVSADVLDVLRKQSSSLDESTIIHLIKSFSELEAQIKYMSGKRTLIEIEIIKLCKPSLNTDNDAVLSRLNQIEQEFHSGMLEVERFEQTHPSVEQAQVAKPVAKVELRTDAFPEDIKAAIKDWPKVILSATSLLKAALREAKPFYLNDERLSIICKDDVQKNFLSEEGNLGKIEEVLAQLHGKSFDLNIIAEKDYASKNQASIEDVDRAIDQLRKKINFDVEVR